MRQKPKRKWKWVAKNEFPSTTSCVTTCLEEFEKQKNKCRTLNIRKTGLITLKAAPISF